jgi:hypothetical protein
MDQPEIVPLVRDVDPDRDREHGEHAQDERHDGRPVPGLLTVTA